MTRYVLRRSDVRTFDMSRLRGLSDWHRDRPHFEADGEWYRLLAALAAQAPPRSTLVDVGTYAGFSALALAYPSLVGRTVAPLEHSVVTYDVIAHVPRDAAIRTDGAARSRIAFRRKDVLEDVRGVLAGAAIVALDASPQDGVFERRLYDALVASGFGGLLVVDDIHLSAEMRAFWDGIDVRKVDATALGHWSGTGIACFGDDSDVVLDLD